MGAQVARETATPVQPPCTLPTSHTLPCNGKAVLRCWSILPGIDLVKMEFDTSDSFAESLCRSNLIDIHYCLSGVFEMEMLNRSTLCLHEGELCINTLTNKAASYSFPKKRFLGINLIIDLDSLSDDTRVCLSLFDIDVGKLGGDTSQRQVKDIWFHGMAPGTIRQVAEDMFRGDTASSAAYLRLKTIELLYQVQRLSRVGAFDPSPRSDKAVNVAAYVKDLLMGDLSRNTTLGSLLGHCHEYRVIESAALSNIFFSGGQAPHHDHRSLCIVARLKEIAAHVHDGEKLHLGQQPLAHIGK